MSKQVLSRVAAAAAAAAVLVWVLVTHWLQALVILGVAGVLAVALKHGDRLSVAWWPSRRRQDGDAAPPASTAPRKETDPWL